MPGSFSDYLENAALNYVFGSTAYSPSGTYYLGLSTTCPTDANGNVNEPAGGAYARRSITNAKSFWSTSTTGVIINMNEVAFPEATASWGSIAYFVMYDQSAGGNLIVWGSGSTPKTIDTGDIARFGSGNITISLE